MLGNLSCLNLEAPGSQSAAVPASRIIQSSFFTLPLDLRIPFGEPDHVLHLVFRCPLLGARLGGELGDIGTFFILPIGRQWTDSP